MDCPHQQFLQSEVYSREEYATKQFWDNRYKQKQTYFDWYAEFPELKQTLQKQYHLEHHHSILMLGCGNSKLSEQMYEAGYHKIVNIDISPTVIEQMSKISEEKGYHQMKWLAMDATNMDTIKDNTFDVVIDKGTLDALISGKNLQICQKMLKESSRILKKDGQIVLITYGSPEGRMKLFESSLGLSKFDYYFTRVDLSPMSTLINLMRSNLGNKPLSDITKDKEIMRKSMMEFNLIKILRRKRKNQKKYIIWSNFTTSTIPHPVQHQPNSQQKTKQIQQTLGQQEKNPQLTHQQKLQPEVSYNPKKQSFCFVYSIKRKFAYDFQQICEKFQEKIQENGKISEKVVIQGEESSVPIGIYSEQCISDLHRAVYYLKQTQIVNCPVSIYPTLEDLANGNEQIKINLKYGDQNVIPILSKSVYEVQIKCTSNGFKQISERVEKICRQLIQNGGLEVHPSPNAYEYFGSIMQKIQPKLKLSQFIKIHWYPTFKLITFSQNIAKFHISTPPTLKKEYCLKIINQTLSPLKSTFKLIREGYLHFHDFRIITLINFCSMNFSNGQATNFIVDDFINNINDKYVSQTTRIYIKKQKTPHTLARILSTL